MDATDEAPTEPASACAPAADGIAWLTLNRPAARNALSMALMEALDAALAEAAADAAVQGGGDRGQRARRSPPATTCGNCAPTDRAGARRCSPAAPRLMTRIVRLPKPVIARVHGVATAAGCQLVASCDLAVAAEDRPLRHAGRQHRPVLLDADGGADPRGGAQGGDGDAADRGAIDAARAREIGLVNRVVPAAELDDAVRALAAQHRRAKARWWWRSARRLFHGAGRAAAGRGLPPALPRR